MEEPTFRIPTPQIGWQINTTGGYSGRGSPFEIESREALPDEHLFEHASELDSPVGPTSTVVESRLEPAEPELASAPLSKKEKKMAKKRARLWLTQERPAANPTEVYGMSPAAPEGWIFCGAEGQKITPSCELWQDHIMGYGSLDCESCRLFVQMRLSG